MCAASALWPEIDENSWQGLVPQTHLDAGWARSTAEQTSVTKWHRLPQLHQTKCAGKTQRVKQSLTELHQRSWGGLLNPMMKVTSLIKTFFFCFLEKENAFLLHWYMSGQCVLVLTNKRRQKQWALLPSTSFESHGPPDFPFPAKRPSVSQTRVSCSAALE